MSPFARTHSGSILPVKPRTGPAGRRYREARTVIEFRDAERHYKLLVHSRQRRPVAATAAGSYPRLSPTYSSAPWPQGSSRPAPSSALTSISLGFVLARPCISEGRAEC